jgi:predicted esterase YcpF (UPF0227 family)
MKMTDNVLELDATPWRLFEPNQDDRDWCVLWLQGFLSTVEGHTDGIVRLANATATPFAMLNYAGHGNHPCLLDNATRLQQFNEVVGVYDALKELGFKRVVVIGGSFGGYMAALLANEREVETLVLRAPANYPEEEFDLAYKDTAAGQKDKGQYLYRENRDEHYMNNAVKSVEGFTGATYVIEHEKDEVINPSIPKSYYNAAKHGNYLVIPGVKHSPKLMPNPEGYFALIELWLATIVNATKKSKDLD